jgi:hypothetical protein
MTIELNSFNEVFSEAARRKLLLNSFHQVDAFRWRANWRTAHHDTKPQIFYECVETDKPFTAIRDALLVAAGDAPPETAVAWTEPERSLRDPGPHPSKEADPISAAADPFFD